MTVKIVSAGKQKIDPEVTKQLFPEFALGNRSKTMGWQNGPPETPVIDVELFCNIC